MHFLHYHLLTKRLQENSVSQKEYAVYLAGTIIMMLLTAYTTQDSDASTLTNIYLFLGYVACSIWGVYYSYSINARGDNKNYVERFICLSFPLHIHALLLHAIIIASILYGLIFIALMTQQTIHFNIDLSGPSALIGIVLQGVYFYYLMGKELKKISQQ